LEFEILNGLGCPMSKDFVLAKQGKLDQIIGE
jgi:hypothetical protein